MQSNISLNQINLFENSQRQLSLGDSIRQINVPTALELELDKEVKAGEHNFEQIEDNSSDSEKPQEEPQPNEHIDESQAS